MQSRNYRFFSLMLFMACFETHLFGINIRRSFLRLRALLGLGAFLGLKALLGLGAFLGLGALLGLGAFL